MSNTESTLQGAIHITSVAYVEQAALTLWRVSVLLDEFESFNRHFTNGLTNSQVPILILLVALLRTVWRFLAFADYFHGLNIKTTPTLHQLVRSLVKLKYKL